LPTRRSSDVAERQVVRVDEQIDVVAQELRHVLRVVPQRRHPDDDLGKVRQQLRTEAVAALGAGRRARKNSHVELALAVACRAEGRTEERRVGKGCISVWYRYIF